MRGAFRLLAAGFCLSAIAGSMTAALPADAASADRPALAAEFAHEVRPLLHLSGSDEALYAWRLDGALAAARVRIDRERFVVLVDRNPAAQALLLPRGTQGSWTLVGASAVSTGLPGRFDHFETATGVFDHDVDNPDFRAEGTRNALGICGCGRQGSRVYDFGWATATKGWGDRRPMSMRLQMHATDPDRLEPRLGTAQSKGCIRISASLNAFVDHFGILDEDYEAKIAEGRGFWVLLHDRAPTAWSGRYLVVVDSRGDAD